MANNIKGITIEIGGDTTKLDKALNGTNKNIRGTQNELKEVNRLLKLDPKNTELAAQKQTLLKNAVSETKEKLDILKTAEKQVQEQFQKGDATEEQYRAIQREVVTTEQSLKSLEGQAEQSNATLEKVGDAFGTIGKKSTELGKKMMPVTAGITAMGGASVAAAMELDNGYDTIITKTGATGETLEELTNVANNIFTNMPTDMDNVGTAVGEVNTRFRVTGETLENLSKEFIQFAEINGVDLNNSIGATDKIMEQWNIDAAETGNLLGLITKKGQDTGITVDTLMQSVQQNGATFKEMGLNLTQSIDLLAQFEANGVNTETAMAGLKKSVKNYTDQGKSTDEALKITIENIKNASSETEALSIAQEVFGTKGAAEMSKAIREGRIDLDSLSASMDEYGNVVSDTFKATQDPWDEATVAMNNLKLAGADLGTSLLSTLQPTITKVVDKVKEFTQWFKNLSDSQKETIIKIALLVAAIGPALMIFGKMSTGISGVIKIVGGLTTKLIGMSKIIIALTGPVGIVIGVIAALVTGFIALYKTSDEFKAKVDEIVEKIKNAIDLVKNILQAWVSFTINFLEGFGTNVKQIFTNIWNEIVAIFQGVGQWFFDRFAEAYTAITTIFSAIGGWFAARWQDIKNSLATVATWFLTMFTNAYTNATNVFSVIGGWFAARWQDIKNSLATVPEWFKTQFDSAWTNIKNAFANVTSFFSELWEKIKNCFVNVGTAIGSAVGDAFKSAINSCLSTIEGVVNKFIKMINGVIGIINDIPGVSLSKIDALSLPRLAKGGVLKEGTAMVAEAGPELLSMVKGKAVVTPLTGSAANTATDALKGNSSGFSQQINITSPKALSAYEIARQTRIQTRRAALAIVRG